MKHFLYAGLFFIGLSGCASLNPVSAVRVGNPESEVVRLLGKPTHVYQDGKDRILEYMHGPMGQTTELAKIGADGKLISIEQVLTLQKFGSLKVGQANKDEVLRTVGAPSQVNRYPFSQMETWSYPYKEQGVWDSMMSLYFDQSNILRKLENGPDPYRMPNDRGKN